MKKKNIKLKFEDDFNQTCMGMFLNCVNIKKIKFINFDGCKFISNMFEGCSSLRFFFI